MSIFDNLLSNNGGSSLFGNSKDFLSGNSDALMQLGAGLLAGRTANEQLGLGLSGFASARKDAKTKNSTLNWLRDNNPDLAKLMETGAVSPTEAVKMAWDQRTQSQKPKNYSFETLPNGDYGNYDHSAGVFTKLGSAPKSSGSDDYSTRQAAAAQFGLTPQSPGYQSFILTGKMPREDAQPLTATDKKAILEADDQVLTNKNALDSLTSASNKNNDAYSGWTAGARTWIGNNMPDWAVPDSVASPKNAAATTEYDNQVMNSALGQLKAIFGGNPTEGERAVLLDLQASSSKPPEVRKAILDRAQKLAQIRMDYNRQRADELRGGTYYQPQAGGISDAAPAGQTGAGVPWRVK